MNIGVRRKTELVTKLIIVFEEKYKILFLPTYINQIELKITIQSPCSQLKYRNGIFPIPNHRIDTINIPK